MYLMYVDESGDVGTTNSPTKYFILSALVVHETTWQDLLNDVIALKRSFKAQYGLLMKEEIHAAEFIQRRIKTKNNIPRNIRFTILKRCIDWLQARTDVSVITVRVDKSRQADPFEYAWKILIQRFDNTLFHNNFPGPRTGTDKGMIICDNTDGGKLTKLLRKMRRYNQINNMVTYGTGSRNIPLRAIVEDPVMRDSQHSFILQIMDVVAYFARQVYETNKFLRSKGGKSTYGKLLPVINRYATVYNTPYKIVEV